jgi:hypothetical protein
MNISSQNWLVDWYKTKGNMTATFDDGTTSLLYVPTDGGPVGFTTSTDNSSQITTGYGFYGHVIFIDLDDSLETEWTVLPTSDDTIFQLYWSYSTKDTYDVALRNVAPS